MKKRLLWLRWLQHDQKQTHSSCTGGRDRCDRQGGVKSGNRRCDRQGAGKVLLVQDSETQRRWKRMQNTKQVNQSVSQSVSACMFNVQVVRDSPIGDDELCPVVHYRHQV